MQLDMYSIHSALCSSVDCTSIIHSRVPLHLLRSLRESGGVHCTGRVSQFQVVNTQPSVIAVFTLTVMAGQLPEAVLIRGEVVGTRDAAQE